MIRLLALVPLVALAACDQSVATAPIRQRPTVESTAGAVDDVIRDNPKIDIGGTIDSPCTGETIVLDGSSHIVMTLDETSDGATLKYHFNTQGLTGVGLETGTKYQIVQILNQDETAVFIPSNGSGTVVIHERVISDGNAGNFLIDVGYTFTFPPFSATYSFRNLRCEG